MQPKEFVAKWGGVVQKERAVSPEHFIDLCRLVYYREYKQGSQPFDRTTFDKETRKSVTRAEIEELDDIHAGLDTAVLHAYNWPPNLTDEQILEHLLALNLERAR